MASAESDDLLSRAQTCRRIAEGMGADPLAAKLIEIAEDYEARAKPTQDSPLNEPPLA